MDLENFREEAQGLLNIFLDFYSPFFAVTPDFMLSETKLNALTEYHSREEKAMFGMKLNRLGNEANEYGMYWFVEDFTPEALKQAAELIDAAERQLVTLHPAHGSSLLSLVILTGRVFDGAAASLKKYRFWKNYHRQGMLTARLAVIDVYSQHILCSKDGKELKTMLQKALAGKTLLEGM